MNPPSATPLLVAGDHFIDRTSRSALADAIRYLLSDKLTEREFLLVIDECRHSPDSAVRFAARDLFVVLVDDCELCPATVEKPTWDYLQRMLLMLESSCAVETTRTRYWSWRQGLAGVALLSLALVAIQFGWGLALLATIAICYCISLGVAWRRRRIAPPEAIDFSAYPFANLAQLRRVYAATRTFRKKKSPRPFGQRGIYIPGLSYVGYIPVAMFWILLLPLVLFVQMFPFTEMRTRIVLS